MLRKGFTLLELMIVIIIIGVLATVGTVQYAVTVEKSRGSEPRSLLGGLRQLCASKWMESGNTTACSSAAMFGNATGVPGSCNNTHYFAYSVSGSGNTTTFTATRCTTGGKAPQGGSYAGQTFTLTSNYQNGSDSWGGNGIWH